MGIKIKKKIKDYLQIIICVLTTMLPKKRRFVLRGFPDYEDNLLAMYKALRDRNIKDIVWIVDDTKMKPPIDLCQPIKIVKRGGFRDFYYSTTSKYLFITHGHFLASVPKSQVCINLWHGIPFKRVGVMQGMKKRRDTYLISTSAFTRKIFHESFEMPVERIPITGQPRTDLMIRAKKDVIINRLFDDKNLPKFIFVCLPTFRQTNYKDGKLDGKSFGNIFNCSDFSVINFNNILRMNDAYCIVKPHPMTPLTECTNESNIIFIDEKWLRNRETSLYELVGAADCLISDISSVIADFMLLDRPIVLLFEDIEEYENSRGFSFNPITDYLPAKVSRNFGEFISEIKKVLADQDDYKDLREKIKHLFFDYSDENSAKRVLDIALDQ